MNADAQSTSSSTHVSTGTQPAIPFWLKALSRLPLSTLYGFASLIAFVATYIARYRRAVVDENLRISFPDASAEELKRFRRDYYSNFAQVIAEIIKSASIDRSDLIRRVQFRNLDAVAATIALGRPVLLAAAHQCNWEWMLLGLSAQLQYPLDGAYKPLQDKYSDDLMLSLRSRFGARLIPAKGLLGDILQKRKELRAIAIVADQEPKSAEFRHWTRFLNRDTAFYMGVEEIARATRFPVFFTAMRRVSKGHYEVTFTPLTQPNEKPAVGELIDRYAKAVEDEIKAAPADWTWSHKRWKLKKPTYGSARPGT